MEVAQTQAPSEINFVAIKVGDVNSDALVNANSEMIKPRSDNGVKFIATDRFVQKGEVIELEISAENFNKVFGYQFTTNFSGMTVIDVTSGAIEVNSENVGYLNDEVVTMSWTEAEGRTISEEEVLFTLTLKAEKAGRIADMIEMDSRVTRAEAYVGESLEVATAELEIRTEQGLPFALYQNEPNPFRDLTTIRYELPKAGQAKLTILDVTGKVIYNTTVQGARGSNQLILNRRDLPARAGVMMYKLEMGEYSAVKKMIVIE